MADDKAKNGSPASTLNKSGSGNAPSAEPPISEYVTPEILDAVLKSFNRPDMEVVDFEAKPATATGDNYMGIMVAVKLRLKNSQSGEIETRPLILKVMPRNEFRLQMIKQGNFFVKEVQMYQDVLPTFEKFQKDLGLPDSEIWTPWPHCYVCKTDGVKDFLIMEDLKIAGFKMANRQTGLDLDHSKLVLKSMAKFHAISYAMFQGDYDKIREQYPWLEDLMFRSDKMPEFFKQFSQNTFAKQATEIRAAGEEREASLIEKIYSDTYSEDLFELIGTPVRWAVIGHGDAWTNNFLFRYDKETNKPVEVKLVDFQLSRVASRAVDIHYFLYSSPKPEILNENEGEMENTYFEEFTKFAGKLGVDVKGHELTRENFEKEISKFRYYGCVTGFFLAMITSAESSDVPEMESITQEEFEGKKETGSVFAGKMKERAIGKTRNIAARHLPRCEQMRRYL